MFDANPRTAGSHAAVIGGSIAGLLAARVLSERFTTVTIIERDALPEGCEHRRGTPHARHSHGLLAGGQDCLEKLLPGLSAGLLRAGAVNGDVARDVRWFNHGACLRRFRSCMEGQLMSRPLLEATIRNRVLAIANVRSIQGYGVQGLLHTADRRRITGIRMPGGMLYADLVVDATGRGSRTPQWLEAMGYEKPVEERVQVALGYTTRLFRRRPRDLDGDVAAVIVPTPEGKRGGAMLAQEGERWTVTLFSHFGNYAPEALDGFIEFSRTLQAPYIYDVIRNAEPVGEPASFRFPANLRRRYERLTRFPEGLLVFGDAISSFNPVYGQGMSVAAQEALELTEALNYTAERDAGGLAREFFGRASKVVDVPWQIAVGNDIRMPETEAPRSASVNLVNWYMGKLLKAAHTDETVALAFHRVLNLVAPPPSLMRPRIASRVLWRNLFPAREAARRETTTARAAAHRSVHYSSR